MEHWPLPECSVFIHVSMQREVLLNMESRAVGLRSTADKEVLTVSAQLFDQMIR